MQCNAIYINCSATTNQCYHFNLMQCDVSIQNIRLDASPTTNQCNAKQANSVLYKPIPCNAMQFILTLLIPRQQQINAMHCYILLCKKLQTQWKCVSCKDGQASSASMCIVQYQLFETIHNKLASLEATLVGNYDLPSDRLTVVKCRATGVAKNKGI